MARHALLALAALVAALAVAARGGVVVANWYSSTSFTQQCLPVGDENCTVTQVPNPSRILTVTCSAGDTFVLQGMDTDSHLPKTITLNCTGSTHTWDIYPVDQVPISSTLYQVQVDVISPYLTQLRPDSIAAKIRKLQAQSATDDIIYLNDTQSLADLADNNAIDGGNRRRDAGDRKRSAQWQFNMISAATFTASSPGYPETMSLIYPFNNNYRSLYGYYCIWKYDTSTQTAGALFHNPSVSISPANFDSAQAYAYCYPGWNCNSYGYDPNDPKCEWFPANNGATQTKQDCNAVSRVARSGIDSIAAGKSMTDQIVAPSVASCEQLNKLGALQDMDYASKQASEQKAISDSINDAGYQQCSNFFQNSGINYLHSCVNEIVQVQIAFKQALEQMLDAIQTTNQRIDALADELQLLYSRELQTEKLVNQQAINFQQLMSSVQQLAGAVNIETAITSSVQETVSTTALVSQQNDYVISTRLGQLNDDLIASTANAVNYVDTVAARISAQTSLDIASVLTLMLQGDALSMKRTRDLEFALNARIAELTILLSQSNTQLQVALAAIQAEVTRNYEFSVTIGNTVTELVKMELNMGNLPIDYHRGIKRMQELDEEPFLEYIGTPPIDLVNNYTMVSFRTLELDVLMVFNTSDPAAQSTACPLLPPSEIPAMREFLDTYYKDVQLDSIQVPYLMDRTYARYWDYVAVALQPAGNPTAPYLYISSVPGACMGAGYRCAACSSPDSYASSCLTSNFALASKFQIAPNPAQSMSFPYNETVVAYNATANTTIYYSEPDPFVSYGDHIQLLAANTSAFYGTVLSISNVSQCVSTATTYGENPNAIFTIHPAASVTEAALQGLPVRYMSGYTPSDLAIQNIVLVAGNGKYLGAGLGNTCTIANVTNATLAFNVYFVPSYAWGSPPPAGRRRAPVDQWNVQGRGVRRAVQPSAQEQTLREARAGLARRSGPSTCATVTDNTNDPTTWTTANAQTCVSNSSCLYVNYALRPWALIAQLSTLDGQLLGIPQVPGISAASTSDVCNTGSCPSYTFSPTDVQTFATLSSPITTVETFSWNQNATFHVVGSDLYKSNVSPAPNLMLGGYYSMGQSSIWGEPVYVIIGVPLGTRVTIRVEPSAWLTSPTTNSSGVNLGKINPTGARYTATFRLFSDGVSDISYYILELAGPFQQITCPGSTNNYGIFCSLVGTTGGSFFPQVPGSISIIVENDPSWNFNYRTKCIPNTPSGTGNILNRNCNGPGLPLPYTYCTGSACGAQSTTTYYNTVVKSTSNLNQNNANPAVGAFLSQTTLTTGGVPNNYVVNIKGSRSASGSPVMSGDTNAGPSYGTLTVAPSTYSGNLFSNVAPYDSVAGISPFNGYYLSCVAACHLLTTQYDCAVQQAGVCTWRYFAALEKNYCMLSNFDLLTSCSLLDQTGCQSPQYANGLCTWTGSTCVANSTIAATVTTNNNTRFIGECQGASPGKWSPLQYSVPGNFAGLYTSAFSYFDTVFASDDAPLSQPTTAPGWRTCIWDRANNQGIDLDAMTYNRVQNWVPCALRFVENSGNEFDCLWNTYPAIDLSGTTNGSYAEIAFLPYCAYIELPGKGGSQCVEYVRELSNVDGLIKPNPSIVKPNNLSVCFQDGVYCSFEISGTYPQTNAYQLQGTTRYGWYVDNGASRTNINCDDYSDDLDACTIKTVTGGPSNPVAQCTVYGGKCIKPCALFQGDPSGCVYNNNGSCYYNQLTGNCSLLVNSLQAQPQCRNPPGNCVFIGTYCNLYYSNQTACIATAGCTWLAFNASLTTEPSYCTMSALVVLPSCINSTTYQANSYCDAGDGLGATTETLGLESNCSPYSTALEQGQQLTVEQCMAASDENGQPCVYLQTITSLNQCFSPSDTQYLLIANQYAESLGAQTITRDSWQSAKQPTTTTYTGGWTLNQLQDLIIVPGTTLNMAKPDLGIGVNLNLEGVLEFYPCPIESSPVVNAGGLCCDPAEYTSLGACNGPSRTINTKYPDQQFKVFFQSYCEATNPGMVVKKTNVTMNIYNLVKIEPEPGDPNYALDSAGCPTLNIDENSTSTVYVGTASVYPWVELDVARRLNLLSRFTSLQCTITYQVGDVEVELVRISESTLNAIANYYTYRLYDSVFQLSELGNDPYGNFNGEHEDLSPLNATGLLFTYLPTLLLNDQMSTVATLQAQYGNDPRLWMATIGRGATVTPQGGTEGMTDITSMSWIVQWASYNRTFVPIYELNNYRSACTSFLTVKDTTSGNVTTIYPRSCTISSDYGPLLPADFSHLIHVQGKTNNRIYTIPDKYIDVSSPREARVGKIGSFSTGDPSITFIDYSTFKGLVPSADWRFFTANVAPFSGSRDPNIDSWRYDWCGALYGFFTESSEIDFVLSLSMLANLGYVNANGLLLAQQWNNTLATTPGLSTFMRTLVIDMQAYWDDAGCPVPLTNHAIQNQNTLNVTANDVVYIVAEDMFWQVYQLYLSANASGVSYADFFSNLTELYLQPLIDSKVYPYWYACAGERVGLGTQG